MEGAQYALSLPSGNIYKQTFIKRIERRGGQRKEYTYTTEMRDMQANEGREREAMQDTEYYAWVNPDNAHNESDNAEAYDKQ